MITQEQLEAGADAVEALAKQYRVSWYVNRDKCRMITAAVLKAVENLKEKAPMTVSKSTKPLSPAVSKMVDDGPPPKASTFDHTLVTQISAVLTVVVPALLVLASNRGWIPPEIIGGMTEYIIQIIVGIFALWAFITNRKTAQIARVANMSEVAKVVTTKGIADVKLADNPKVVSH